MSNELPPEVTFPVTVTFSLHEFLKMKRVLEHELSIVNMDRNDAAEMWMKLMSAAGLNPIDPRIRWREEQQREQEEQAVKNQKKWFRPW